MKIYVASSWRNPVQPDVVLALRSVGHEVYDFKNPREGDKGFHWREIDPEWKSWTPEKFRESLAHPLAVNGFKSDFEAMEWADAGVLVMPCGRSAHLEAGYFIGARKPLAILLSDGEPELMYRMATHVCASLEEVVEKMQNSKINEPSSDIEGQNGDGKLSSLCAEHCWINNITPCPDCARIANAERLGWTDIHGGPPDGAFWRGTNPKTGRVEEIPG